MGNDNELSTFVGEYKEYYNGLDGNVENKSTELKNNVEDIYKNIETITQGLTEWSGNAGDSYREIADIMTNRFKEIENNIKNNLTPACEAIDQLHQELGNMKNIDANVISLTNSIAVKESNPEDPTIYCSTPCEGSGKNAYCPGHTNPNYKPWLDELNRLKTELEQEKIKLQESKEKCDALILKIKILESSIMEFKNLVGFTSQLGGVSLNNNIDIDLMTYEQKMEYLGNLVNSYKTIYDELNDFYKDKYGKGITFSAEDFKNIDEIFNGFYLYGLALGENERYAGVNGLLYNGSNFYLNNLGKLSAVIQYCKENDFFGKLKDYVDGKSFEESGLAKLYGESDFKGVNEWTIASYFSTNDYDTDRLKLFWRSKDPSAYIREALKDKISNFETSLNKLYEEYDNYETLTRALATTKEAYIQTRTLYRTAPYEEVLTQEDYLNFVKEYQKNPQKYGDLDDKSIDFNAIYNAKYSEYMTDEEKQIYYYHKYFLGDSEGADKYLDAISDNVRRAYAIDLAYDFVSDVCQNRDPKEFVDNFCKAVGSGFYDGTVDFLDGLTGWVSKTDIGEQDLIDYIKYYKMSFMGKEIDNILNPNDPNYEEMMRKLTDTRDGAKLMGMMRQVYSTSNTIGYMAIPMATSVITHGIGTKIGGIAKGTAAFEKLSTLESWISAGVMGVSSGGNNREQALSEGYSEKQANLYAVASTVWETVSEAGMGEILKGAGTLPSGHFTEVSEKGGILDTVKAIFVDSIGEGLQEPIQGIGNNVIHNSAMGENNNVVDLRQAAEEFKEAGLATLVIGSFVAGGRGARNFAGRIGSNVNTTINQVAANPNAGTALTPFGPPKSGTSTNTGTTNTGTANTGTANTGGTNTGGTTVFAGESTNTKTGGTGEIKTAQDILDAIRQNPNNEKAKRAYKNFCKEFHPDQNVGLSAE